MRALGRMWESWHKTRYCQWNHTHAQSAEKQQRTTNNIAWPSIQVSSLISNGIFNIDAPTNGAIRLNSRYYLKRPGHRPTRNQHQHDTRRRQDIRSVFEMPVHAPRRRTYIWVYDKPWHLPELVLVSGGLHVGMWYVGIPGFNGSTRRI